MTDSPALDLTTLTADIATAYLEHNRVATSDVAGLIGTIHQALHKASDPAPAEAEKLKPAVTVRASVKPDGITCLECGHKAKLLKRHLDRVHGLSPAQYRVKWELPRDYPMVAPDYAERRATLAKSIGLGRRKMEDVAEPVVKARRKLGIAFQTTAKEQSAPDQAVVGEATSVENG